MKLDSTKIKVLSFAALGVALMGANTYVNGLTSVNLTSINGNASVNVDGAGNPIVAIANPTSFPTPFPYPTSAIGGFLLVAPTALPTLSVVVVNATPVPCATQAPNICYVAPTALPTISVAITNATNPPSTVTVANPTAFPTPIPYPTIGAAPIPVVAQAGAATITTVANSITSVTLLAANASVKSVIICNEVNATLEVSYSAVASTATATMSFSKASATLPDCQTLPLPQYTGIITGIWATSVAGNAVITSVQ